MDKVVLLLVQVNPPNIVADDNNSTLPSAPLLPKSDAKYLTSLLKAVLIPAPTKSDPSPWNEPLNDPLNVPSPVLANDADVALSAIEAVACALKAVALTATEAVPAVVAIEALVVVLANEAVTI